MNYLLCCFFPEVYLIGHPQYTPHKVHDQQAHAAEAGVYDGVSPPSNCKVESYICMGCITPQPFLPTKYPHVQLYVTTSAFMQVNIPSLSEQNKPIRTS